MTDKKPNSNEERKPSRNSRKRPLRRRRKGQGKSAENTQGSPSSSQGNRGQNKSKGETDKSPRNRYQRNSQVRRRRRVRRRSQNEPTTQSIMEDIEQGYTPPSSVFVYTHVVRPSSAGGYEFRSEAFQKSSRRIEDYQIDYSHIMGKILEVDPENLPKYEWYWGPDSEASADENEDAESAEGSTPEQPPEQPQEKTQ